MGGIRTPFKGVILKKQMVSLIGGDVLQRQSLFKHVISVIAVFY